MPVTYVLTTDKFFVITKLRSKKLKINLDTGSYMVDLKEIQKHSSLCVSYDQVSLLGRVIRDKKTQWSLRPIMLISSGFCVLRIYF